MSDCKGCDASCRSELETRLNSGADKMDSMQDDIKKLMKSNEDMQKSFTEIQESLSDFLEAWRNGEGFFKVIGFATKAVLWAGAIAAAITAILHFSDKP